MTPSSAELLLIKTQLYPLGFDHKYKEVSVHMLPHEKDPSASEKAAQLQWQDVYTTQRVWKRWVRTGAGVWKLALIDLVRHIKCISYVQCNVMLHNGWSLCVCQSSLPKLFLTLEDLNLRVHDCRFLSIQSVTKRKGAMYCKIDTVRALKRCTGISTTDYPLTFCHFSCTPSVCLLLLRNESIRCTFLLIRQFYADSGNPGAELPSR